VVAVSAPAEHLQSQIDLGRSFFEQDRAHD
jgi:hypothetical protein